MNNIRNILFCAAMLSASIASAQTLQPAHIASTNSLKSGELYYTYDDGKSSTGLWGTAKKESYDVAIHISDAGLVGKKVEGIEIYFDNDKSLSNASVWLSRSLTLDSNKKNAPDMVSKSVDVAKGSVEVRFDEPYTLTDGDFYAGYSLTVDDLDGDNNKYPLYCTTNADAEGLYLHTSRTYRKWAAKGEDFGIALCMKVIISGIEPISAGASFKKKVSAQVGEKSSANVTVINHGSDPISSIDYTYTLNGETTTGSHTFDTAIPSRYGASEEFSLELPALAEAGVYPFSLSIDKVNGEVNPDADTKAETTVNVYKLLPKHRPVMEEYTGTWCGYCPRGYVGLKLMNEAYPDDFIGLSYHNGDEMTVMSSNDYPSSIAGFPDAYLDRYLNVDAYYGIDYGVTDFGIKNDWEALAAEMAPAEISVVGGVTDDNNTVKVDADVTFIDSYTDGKFHVEYVLVANDLYDDSWGQSNYYSKADMPSDFDVFTKGSSTVYGLHFDDIVVASSRISQAGSADSKLPSTITAYEKLSTSTVFKLDEVKNTSNKDIIQNRENLVVAALLINDSTKHIVNAAKCKVKTDPTGVSSVNVNKDNTVTYYDLSGRKVETANKGIFIKKTADGKVQKVMVK